MDQVIADATACASHDSTYRPASRRGLTSETGQNNCFLNVIIQSLWHLASFREALLGSDPAAVPAPGAPPADARVLTALRNIFRAFQQVPWFQQMSFGRVLGCTLIAIN